MSDRAYIMNIERRPIVIGSFNKAKAAEMCEILKDLDLPVRSLAEFPHVRPIEEDGETFAENARRKALGYARQLRGVIGVVADDSGIEVDALGGRPGVRSARYVSDTATDEERVRRLLEELEGVPPHRRTARFRCAVAFADSKGVIIETEGTVEGKISFEPAGDFGFGYDPIFIPDGYDGTFAQLGPEVKHRISHRAVALRRFHDEFKRVLTEGTLRCRGR